MKLILTKKPKSPIIIQGFPSLGLVSTITTKFLLDHLDTEEIGHIESENIMPLTAIHNSKVVYPITIYYNKKYNIVVVQSLTEVAGHEWELADTMLELAKTVSSKEIIVIESLPSHEQTVNLFYYSNKNKLKLKPISEGIVMGTTAALLLRAEKFPVTCIFAEAHSQMPDSEAAAKVVEFLDNYLKLKIDYKPLLEAAKKFEANLKQFIEKQQSSMASMKGKQKEDDVSYMG